MKLQPSTAPLPAFFAAVRRRHPDVDLVVLPPEREPRAQRPLPDSEVLAARDRAAELAAAAWAAATGLHPGPAPDTRIGYGPDRGTVLVRARLLGPVAEGPAAFDALAAHLARDGWDLHLLGEAGHRLRGRRDDLTVRASYAAAAGALLLEIATDPLPVGTARVRELVGE
jgi:hypothetical protein